jgi:hypothetical protein
MFSYFTELNRKRPPVDLLDFVTHCTNPIVHAADDRSVMQTLEALPFTRSVRAIIGNHMPYRIGLSTIAMRQNPYGSCTFDNPLGKRIAMANFDPRQNGLFAAAWTIGYAARVAEAGLEALTPAAFIGPRGVLGDSTQGCDCVAVRPIFHATRALASLAGRARFACHSGRPGAVQTIAARAPNGSVEAWVANCTDRPLVVRMTGLGKALRAMRSLDADSWPGGARRKPGGPKDHWRKDILGPLRNCAGG